MYALLKCSMLAYVKPSDWKCVRTEKPSPKLALIDFLMSDSKYAGRVCWACISVTAPATPEPDKT